MVVGGCSAVVDEGWMGLRRVVRGVRVPGPGLDSMSPARSSSDFLLLRWIGFSAFGEIKRKQTAVLVLPRAKNTVQWCDCLECARTKGMHGVGVDVGHAS